MPDNYNAALNPYQASSYEGETESKWSPEKKTYETRPAKKQLTPEEVQFALADKNPAESDYDVYSRLNKQGKLSSEDIAKWKAASFSKYGTEPKTAEEMAYYEQRGRERQKVIEKADAAERGRLGEGVQIDYNKLRKKTTEKYDYEHPDEFKIRALAKGLGIPYSKILAQIKGQQMVQEQAIGAQKRAAEAAGGDEKGTSKQPGGYNVISVKDPGTGKMKTIQGLATTMEDGSANVVDKETGDVTYYKKGNWKMGAAAPVEVKKPSGVTGGEGKEKFKVTSRSNFVVPSVDSLKGSEQLKQYGLDDSYFELAKDEFNDILEQAIADAKRKTEGVSITDFQKIMNYYISKYPASKIITGVKRQGFLKILYSLSQNVYRMK